MTARSFRSFAKINLGLEVVGRLPGGYHELKTLFATLSLHDTIEIARARTGISVRSGHADVPDDETNLAHRAALALQKLSGRKSGVAIRIHKRIPVGGGLGGGSSNAAAVLRALDRIWGLGLGPSGLLETARSLGADVPYFLAGGPALGRGRGDDILPLDFRLDQKVLLVPGHGGLSTAAVFGRFAALGGATGAPSRIDAFLRSAERNRDRPTPRALELLHNDLERAALDQSPSLRATARQVRRIGRSTGARQAAMSGSGSCFFLLFDDATARRNAEIGLREAGIFSRKSSFLSRRDYEGRFEISKAWLRGRNPTGRGR